jgi:hypothetical protein
MAIYSLTCTRDKNISPTTTKLLEYFERCGITSKLLIGSSSIFEAYSKGVDSFNPSLDDIVILCHDDIEVLTDPKLFTRLLEKKLSDSNTGFVGVAGTSKFTKSGVWWDMAVWKQALHSGMVFHGPNIEDEDIDCTYFGKTGQVVVLDGLFMAATVRTLRNISLEQPKSFEGAWDFYDIYYTFQAHVKKLKNYTLPIQLRHESYGELAGRDSWHKNRTAFLQRMDKYLPATTK